MVVVSPFVGVPSQSDGKTTMSDISRSLIENKFVQNQFIRQGASLAGVALIPIGSKMIASGDAPRTSFRSHIQLRGSDGKKQFKPYKEGSRSFDKPLKRRSLGGHYTPGSSAYGYRTNFKHENIRQSPTRANAGRVVRGVGRAAGVIGLGLVVYNIHRHGAKETAKSEGKFWVHDIPVGTMGGVSYLDNRFTGGLVTKTSRTSSIIQTTLLSAAIGAVF